MHFFIMEISKEFSKHLLMLEEEKDKVKLNNEDYFVIQIDKDSYYENFSGELIIKGYFIYLNKFIEEFDKSSFLYISNENTGKPDLRFFIKEQENWENQNKENSLIKGFSNFKNKEIKIKKIEILN